MEVLIVLTREQFDRIVELCETGGYSKMGQALEAALQREEYENSGKDHVTVRIPRTL